MNEVNADQPAMVTVHSCWFDGEAEILLSVLREHGIDAETNSRVPHSVLPLTVDGLGEIQVLVAQDQADEARALIEAHAASAKDTEPQDETEG